MLGRTPALLGPVFDTPLLHTVLLKIISWSSERSRNRDFTCLTWFASASLP